MKKQNDFEYQGKRISQVEDSSKVVTACAIMIVLIMALVMAVTALLGVIDYIIKP